MAKKRVRRAHGGSKPNRAPSKTRPRRPPATLSPAAYARRRGVSREAVSKAIRQGRIPVGRGGRIDPTAADAAWVANSLPRPGEPGLAPAPSANGVLIGLTEARTMHEYAKAQLAELELGERSGQLVPVDDMRDAAFRATRAARDLIESIPDRLGDVLAGMTDAAEVRRLLREEHGRALDELSSLELEPQSETRTKDQAG